MTSNSVFHLLELSSVLTHELLSGVNIDDTDCATCSSTFKEAEHDEECTGNSSLSGGGFRVDEHVFRTRDF